MLRKPTLPSISDSALRKITVLIVVLWVLLQLGLVAYFWGAPQSSDPGNYIHIAARCEKAGTWYPSQDSVYSPYIWNPGFINFLIFQIKYLGTTNFNAVFNVLMNLGIVAEIFLLARKLFSARIARFSVILYCLVYSNAFVPLTASTEIPFLFLSLGALCLCASRKYRWILLAGLLFAVANWVRPLVIIFLPAALALFVYEKRPWPTYAALAVPMMLLTFLIGKCNEARMGYFVTQSTTSPLNLIMTANDQAYGGVATSIFTDKNSTGYLENEASLTFEERGKIWKERAVDWIKRNPGRYAFLYVKKLAGLYVEDSWADRPLLGNSGFVDSYVVQKKVGTAKFAGVAALMILKSLVYYAVLLLFAHFLWKNWRKPTFGKLFLLSILVFGTLITCLFCVSPRYHYPFFFTIVICAAFSLNSLIPPQSPSD